MSGLTAAEVLALLAEYGECWCSQADRQRGDFLDGCPKHEASQAAGEAERTSAARLIMPTAVNTRSLRGYLGSGGDNVRLVIAVVLWRVISSFLRREESLEPADGQTFTEAAEAFIRATAYALQIRAEPGLVPNRQGAALYLTQEIELLGLSVEFFRIVADD